MSNLNLGIYNLQNLEDTSFAERRWGLFGLVGRGSNMERDEPMEIAAAAG